MNYHSFQFSKHLQYFLMSYGYHTICNTSAKGRRLTFQLVETIEDVLKCYISLQNDSKLFKQLLMRIAFICLSTTSATYDRSSTHRIISITLQEILQMLRKLVSRAVDLKYTVMFQLQAIYSLITDLYG